MGFTIKKPADVHGSAAPAILIGLFVSFGGVLFGYDTGTIGGILAMPYWRNLFSTGYINKTDGKLDVSSTQKSEIVSILSAGTFFGALLSAPVADFLGRRMGMIFNTGVFTLGVILQTVATTIPVLVAGRFFAGLGVGLLSGIYAICYGLELSAHSSSHYPTVPIRDSSQMDSRNYRRLLPMGYHDWSATRCDRLERDQGQTRHRLIPHSNWRSIRLFNHLGRRHADLARNSALFDKEGQQREGCKSAL